MRTPQARILFQLTRRTYVTRRVGPQTTFVRSDDKNPTVKKLSLRPPT